MRDSDGSNYGRHTAILNRDGCQRPNQSWNRTSISIERQFHFHILCHSVFSRPTGCTRTPKGRGSHFTLRDVHFHHVHDRKLVPVSITEQESRRGRCSRTYAGSRGAYHTDRSIKYLFEVRRSGACPHPGFQSARVCTSPSEGARFPSVGSNIQGVVASSLFLDMSEGSPNMPTISYASSSGPRPQSVLRCLRL